MSGKEKKAADLEEKLQLLRSVTKSNAANETSILVDASKYIRELKDKVEAAGAGTVSVSLVDLVDNISKSSSSSRRGGGFRINVSMERSRPGLLVSVLQVLEELGLDVLDADVSCADDTPFRLQALGGRSSSSGRTTVDDEQVVRQAVLQAITKCMMGHNEGDDDDE
ncbi:hypothetical protein PR202_gb16615 [Eleusine coracana subsp. coracana]|uniref:Plant bHLH transcription factor ACT-like domain-containing protein n=1 Tax=Eleusine coracana subsp. coracana TaxID=191504 RepID=A0AAV5F2L0_ELECO|nr:hypothetical protein PR202_gb16615 [Eleusine coracana subsp. coracana]